MKLPKGFVQLFSVMLLLSLVTISLIIYFLYINSIGQLKLKLSNTVKNQAFVIEALMDSDDFLKENFYNRSRHKKVLQKMINSHLFYENKGGLGKFKTAEKKGTKIVFLLTHQHEGNSIIAPVPFNSELSEPVRRILMDKQGEVMELDYRGVTVLAVYYPIVNPYFGIIAKVDLNLIRWPFFKAGLLAAVLSSVLIALGSWIFYRISNPIIKTRERSKANLEIALAAVRKNDRKFQSIFYQSFQMIELLDVEGNIVEVNNTSLISNSAKLDKIVGRPLWESPLWIKNEENSKIIESFVKRALNGESMRREMLIRDDTTEEMCIDFSIKPIVDETGSILFLICEGYDITKRKLSERKLRNSTRAYRLISLCNQAIFQENHEATLLQKICDLVVEVGDYTMCWIGYAQNDPDKKVIPVAQAGFGEGYIKSLDVFWSDTVRGRGPTGTAIRTGKFSTAIDIPNAPMFEPWRENALNCGYVSSVAFPLISSQKTIGALNIYSDNRSSFDQNEMELLQAFANDLSFGIGALQNRTLKSKYEFEMLRRGHAMEQVADSIMITDISGKIEYVNSSFEKVTGYSKDFVIGKKPNLLRSGQHSEKFYSELWGTISDGKIWAGEFINKKQDGSCFHEDATISPIKDSTGKIVNFVAVKQDITEKLKLEKQLKQSQKLEAIGTLAGGIAHDFNNLLFAILGYIELALKKVETGSSLSKYLDIATKSGAKAQHLISQILTFSRQGDSNPKVMEIAPLLRDVTEMLRSMIPSSVEIKVEIPDKPIFIFADPTQIQQVIINLCTNSAQAMGDRPGMLEIICQSIAMDGDKAHLQNLPPGEYLQMIFKDQGIGIPKKALDQIFDPFFTSKPVDQGTGLGLSVVHGIIKNHKGGIFVHSELNRGTSFFVFFPISSKNSELPKTGRERIRGGREKILIIDDQPDIAKLLCLLLEQQGYETTFLVNPNHAVDLIGKGLEKYDLIITDQTMPGITGTDFIREVRKKYTQLPFILISGLSKPVPSDVVKSLCIADLLQKPIDEKILLRSVRTILDKSGGEIG